MSVLSDHHKVLTNGVGKCSVPMWSGGCPAGFCDAPAYGNQLPQEPWQRGMDRAYAPALCCEGHGGPSAPQEKCPPDCRGIEIGDGNFSGCACLGARCDCPNHPAEAAEAPEGDEIERLIDALETASMRGMELALRKVPREEFDAALRRREAARAALRAALRASTASESRLRGALALAFARINAVPQHDYTDGLGSHDPDRCRHCIAWAAARAALLPEGTPGDGK